MRVIDIFTLLKKSIIIIIEKCTIMLYKDWYFEDELLLLYAIILQWPTMGLKKYEISMLQKQSKEYECGFGF